MKVIKPIEVLKDTYTGVNTRDIVPAWSSVTTYGGSSTFDKVWVSYSGVVYESIKPNNFNNIPSSSSTWWRVVTNTTIDDFAFEAWNSSNTYIIGDIVYYQSNSTSWPRYYQSLLNNNSDKIPPNNLVGTNPYWLDLGYSNTSKLYDIESSTQAITTDELITTFTARKATAGGVFGVQGNRILLTAKSEKNLYSSTNWSSVDLGEDTTPELRSMVFSPDKNILLLCGKNGYLKYSKDNGSSWTSCTIPNSTSHLLSLTYNGSNGIFIVVGTSTNNTPIIWKSLDGIFWESISDLPSSSSSLNKVIWIEHLGKFVAAGNNGNIYVSNTETGSVWTASSVGAGTTDLVGIVYNPANGLIHVIGNAVLRYSSDLSSWTAIGVAGNLKAIAVYNSVTETGISSYQYGYVATNAGQGFLAVSSDGIAWTNKGSFGPNSNSLDLDYCYTENKWVIISTVNAVQYIIARNSEDLTYSSFEPTGFGFNNTFIKVFYNKSTDSLFFFGNNNTIITSPVIYFREYFLNDTLVDNWYDYFYQDYTLLTETVFQSIPSYTKTRITISIVGDIVRCGIVFAGSSYPLGTTQYGASAGIIDYSKKETDEFGVTTFIRRAFSKRMNVNLILPSSDLYRIQKILSDIRATPCVWIGSEAEIYRPLVMYGYYRDFNLEIPYPEYSYCSLQIEGLTE